jgi:hypothetical protein
MEEIFNFYIKDCNKVKSDNGKYISNLENFSIFNFIKELNLNNYEKLNKDFNSINNNFINEDIKKFENIEKLKYEDIENFFNNKNFNYIEKGNEANSNSNSEDDDDENSENKNENEEEEKENEEEKKEYLFIDSENNNIKEYKKKFIEDKHNLYKGVKFEINKKKLFLGNLFVTKEEISDEFQGIIIQYDENNKIKTFQNGTLYYDVKGKEDFFKGYLFIYENDKKINVIFKSKFYIIFTEEKNDLKKMEIIKKNSEKIDDKTLNEHYYYLENNYLYKETQNEFICYYQKSSFSDSNESFYIINFSIDKQTFINSNYMLNNKTKIKIIFDNNNYYEGKINPIIENNKLKELQFNDKNGLFLIRLKDKKDYNNFEFKIEGEFENNKIIKGKVTTFDKDQHKYIIFEGNFENNKIKNGTYNFSDKISYIGEFYNNNCHGKGKFINNENFKIKSIEGEFFNGNIKVIYSINDEKYNKDEEMIIENVL